MITDAICEGIGCKCEQCAVSIKGCCTRHSKVQCPDDAYHFDPDYVCPDFKPREEEHNNAAD